MVVWLQKAAVLVDQLAGISLRIRRFLVDGHVAETLAVLDRLHRDISATVSSQADLLTTLHQDAAFVGASTDASKVRFSHGVPASVHVCFLG